MNSKDTLTVPSKASEATIDYIRSSFDELFGRHIDFKLIKKDSIIGGFIAEIDGEIYDAAVSSRLAELRKHFSGKR